MQLAEGWKLLDFRQDLNPKEPGTSPLISTDNTDLKEIAVIARHRRQRKSETQDLTTDFTDDTDLKIGEAGAGYSGFMNDRDN